MVLRIDNPGSNLPWPKETLRRVGSRILGHLRLHDSRGAWNALLSGSANLINQLHNETPRYHCPCCGYAGHSFVHSSNRLRIAWQSICPQCRSRGRHRGLSYLLPDLIARKGPCRVLHFAPEPILVPALTGPGVEYATTDRFLKDVGFPGEDIQNLTFADQSFDMVLTNHVLEHVPDDGRALAELARVLRPRGIAVITVPGEWSRKQTVIFPDLSFNGHYRDYGIDFVDLMRLSFRQVEVVDLHNYDHLELGLSCGIRPRELAFLGKSPSPPPSREGSGNS